MDFYIRVEVGDHPFYVSVTQDEFNAFIELIREEFDIDVTQEPGKYVDGVYVRYSTRGENKHYLGFVYKY